MLVDIFLHNKEEGKWLRGGRYLHISACEQKARSVLNKSQEAEGLMDVPVLAQLFLFLHSVGWNGKSLSRVI